MTGRRLLHYVILDELGRGGMGVVYRAHDTRLHRQVAIKLLPADAINDHAAAERLRREARAASALSHPNICTIFDLGEDNGELFFVMELLSGSTLDSRISGKPLPVPAVVAWGIEIADALETAHIAGIIHRDIKPANVFVTGRGHVKILDFGLAKSTAAAPGSASGARADTSLTQPGAAIGTVAYMSPEQAAGAKLDARSDVFSAGTVLYEMATGKNPFAGQTIALVFDSILNSQPVAPSAVNAQVSRGLDKIILRALEKNPAARYQSSAALRNDLVALNEQLASASTAARSAAPPPSVAVLYFENLSGASEEEFFRDGITEDITTELARIQNLRVFPRAAVIPFRNRSATPAEVREQLDATHVLTGSVRRAAERLRVSVQLIEAQDGLVVWAARYDRQSEDVFAVQEEVARSVAQALRISLSAREDEIISRRSTLNADAYDFFLRGRTHTRRQNRELALEMFERALELDPTFALAHAGIANICAMQYYLKDRDPVLLQKASASVERAFSLAPQLPEAFVALARIRYAQQRFDEAIEAASTAVAAKPDCDSSWDLLGRALFAAGRLEEAALLVDRAITATGDDYNVYVPFGNVMRALGREREAAKLSERLRAVLERQIEFAPEDTRARIILAVEYAYAGRVDEALTQVGKVRAIGTSDPHTTYNIACVYGVLGKKAEAIEALQRAADAGYGEWTSAARDPDLSILHGDPDFERLLANGRARG